MSNEIYNNCILVCTIGVITLFIIEIDYVHNSIFMSQNAKV